MSEDMIDPFLCVLCDNTNGCDNLESIPVDQKRSDFTMFTLVNEGMQDEAWLCHVCKRTNCTREEVYEAAYCDECGNDVDGDGAVMSKDWEKNRLCVECETK
tara:strand:+ start:641 stop:946 length:306 start_codon:yes stop_codon:yes gene_type:complete